MKISQLKVGDRVKYRIRHGISGTNSSNFEIKDGNILEIREELGGFFQIENAKYWDNQISVTPRDIISKLEPIQQNKYIEIPIKKENPIDYYITRPSKQQTIKNYRVALFLKDGQIIEGEIQAKNSRLACSLFASKVARERKMFYFQWEYLLEDVLVGEI